jgi:hypothetical protein
MTKGIKLLDVSAGYAQVSEKTDDLSNFVDN